MFWVFCSCFGCFRGVLAVFRWCFGGIEGMVFSQPSWLTCQRKNGHQRKREALLLGLYAGLINPAGFSSAVIFVNVPFFSETQNGMEAV